MKGSLKVIKLKYLLFCFAGVLLCALPLRVYQLFALVETDTGFYSGNDFTVTLLYVLLAVFSAVIIFLSYLSGEIPSPELPTGKNKLLGTAGAILGVGLLWNVAEELTDIVENIASKIHIIGQGDIFSKGDIVIVLKIFAAFLGAIYLFVFCVSNFDGKASYKEQKVLALMPMVWAMCGLVLCLMNEISYIKVSELLLEICLYVFAMLFLMNFARISSSVAYKGVMWQIFAFGLPTAMFGALISIPKLVILIMGKDLVEGYPFDLSALAISAFAVIYIFASLGIGFKQKDKETEELEPETEEEAAAPVQTEDAADDDE